MTGVESVIEVKNMRPITVVLTLLFISLFTFGCGQGSDRVGEDLPLDQSPENTEPTREPGEVEVKVFNGCGVEGLAGKVETRMGALGYTQVKTGNYVDEEGLVNYRINFTYIEYLYGFKGNADELAELLGVSRLEEKPVLPGDVVVVLGKDLDEVALRVDVEYGLPSEEDADLVSLEGVESAINLKPPANGLYIDKSRNIIQLYSGGQLVVEYPCCTGKDGCTPEGSFTVTSKLVDPTWYWQGEAIPPGPDNGLGTHFLGISKKGYGIHGTNEPDSIGYSLSHGCVRLQNEDIEELYGMVDVGTVVVIGP